VFCSDLDRTMIYSNKFLESNGIKEERIVEYYLGEPLSFMSERSIELLKKINSTENFIPVTTRTKEQYERIHIFQETIKPKYAIVENGGKILINSLEDKEWTKYIENKFDELKVSKENVLAEFRKCDYEWILKEKEVKDRFLYFIVDKTIIPEDIDTFFKWLSKQNWEYSLQGRKLYFIPKFINKNDAIKYILDKEKISKYYASGDSFLDAPMVINANHSLVPYHGELRESNLYENLAFTNEIGFKATEEILEDYIQKYIK
jgi:hydroxymethylpyrimidine pyrophosphatase-like HAD family hydrolase